VRVLAIDTAGPVVGVGLLDGDVARARTARVERGTDALLLAWVDELAGAAGIRLSDLDGIGVAAGPGAFTGLRVGLATAAGLALALGVPLWSAGSLAPRAAAAAGTLPVLALLDARKARVYAALVDVDGHVRHGPDDVPPEAALAWTDGPFVATGEGALVYGAVVEAAGGRVHPRADDPAVDVLARLAAEALRAGEGRPATEIAPVYLRAPDARPPKTGVR
jgi:tRNA threonylcarbamoyladenosine biosynthesis protein TsaB